MSDGKSIIYVERELAGQVVRQRAADGYFDATAMCKAAGKMFAHWTETDNTKAILTAFSTDIGITITELIQSVRGGSNQGSWIHPKVAISLAMWLSPPFHVKVCNWVYEGTVTRPGGPMSRAEARTLISDVVFECFRGYVPSLAGEFEAVGKTLRAEIASAIGGIHKRNAALATASATAKLLAPEFSRINQDATAIYCMVSEAFARQQEAERLTFTEFLRSMRYKPSPTNRVLGWRFHSRVKNFLRQNPSYLQECDGTGAKASFSRRMYSALFERDERARLIMYEIAGKNVIRPRPAGSVDDGQPDMFTQH